MSETPETTPADVQQQAEAIVAGGDDVRGKIARLVAGASGAFQHSGEGLIALSRSVLAGAGDALERGSASLPPEGSLRQVIDGLGDGLTTAATSARLALEEARSKGQRFASEDLLQIKNDLASLTSLYAQTVSDALKRVRTEASAELGGLVEHADRVRDRVTPSVQSAIDAVMSDPVGVGKESVQAGLTVGRHAAGSLFSAMGRLLQQAGGRLTGGEPPKP
jgi:hypothetical protein